MENKWFLRWFGSCNHRDIGTLYMMFGFLAALIGLSLSMLIRMELGGSGDMILHGDYELYNAVVVLDFMDWSELIESKVVYL